MFVANSVRIQRFRQRFLVEVRVTLRPGQRPHIDQHLDPVLFQQRNEDVNVARRMANRPDSRDHLSLIAVRSLITCQRLGDAKMNKIFLSTIIGLTTLAFMEAAETQQQPEVGKPAPDFSLTTGDGSQVSLKDFKGKWVVLYFYPKDFTSGCTMEARNFQRDLPKYEN